MIDSGTGAKRFNKYKNVDSETGVASWGASKVFELLGYTDKKEFTKNFNAARQDSNLSGIGTVGHFDRPEGASEYNLSQWACYLIARQGDNSNRKTTQGVAYFSMCTMNQLGGTGFEAAYANAKFEDLKRLFLFHEINKSNVRLVAAAKGEEQEKEEPQMPEGLSDDEYDEYVDELWRKEEEQEKAEEKPVTQADDDEEQNYYQRLHATRYFELYNRRSTASIRDDKGIKKGNPILEKISSKELAANVLVNNIAIDMMKKEIVGRKPTLQEATDRVARAAKAVRTAIYSVNAAMPEYVPGVERTISQLNGMDEYRPFAKQYERLMKEFRNESKQKSEKGRKLENAKPTEAQVVEHWYNGSRKRKSTTVVSGEAAERTQKRIEAQEKQEKQEEKARQLAAQEAARQAFEAAQMKLF